MHKSRYVVMQKDGEWQIKNAYRQVTSTFPSKAQDAVCRNRIGRKGRKSRS